MKTLHSAIHSNSTVDSTRYNIDDKKYLSDLNINNSIVQSSADVDSLIDVVKNLNRILGREYEQWTASEYDSQYGWDYVPDNYVRQNLLDAINKHGMLYLKVISNKAINIYSEDCTDRDKNILSFSVESD